MSPISPKEESKVEETRPMTIMTESDAYISERMKSQPQNLEDIEVEVKDSRHGAHRLSLPDYFEPFSYDCTTGVSCPHHGWKEEKIFFGIDKSMPRWIQTKHGKYVFRWLSQLKRALDESINNRGWLLVNRSLFKEAPKVLFSVTGGVENGDAILGFMTIEKATKIREKPSEDSINRVKSEEEKHEDNPNFYKAKIDSEHSDGDDFAPKDALQEGRDF